MSKTTQAGKKASHSWGIRRFNKRQVGYEDQATSQNSNEWRFSGARRSKLRTRYSQLRRLDAQLYGGCFV
jgi:hypothetical protein